MQALKLPKAVRRITFLGAPAPAAAGGLQVVGTAGDGSVRTTYRRKSKRKKRSRGTKPGERLARRMARAQIRASGVYLGRHDRSNRKRRDGWLRDLPYNMSRAARKGERRLKLRRVLGF